MRAGCERVRVYSRAYFALLKAKKSRLLVETYKEAEENVNIIGEVRSGKRKFSALFCVQILGSASQQIRLKCPCS